MKKMVKIVTFIMAIIAYFITIVVLIVGSPVWAYFVVFSSYNSTHRAIEGKSDDTKSEN